MVPLQTIGVPSAVNRRTPSEEVDLGPGKTETEAPESTKNSLSERISFRNRREKLGFRLGLRLRELVEETGRLERKIHLPDR